MTRQLGRLIRRHDALTCGKQPDFLPARVALMPVIMMLSLSSGLGTGRVQQSTSNVLALKTFFTPLVLRERAISYKVNIGLKFGEQMQMLTPSSVFAPGS